MKAPIASYSRAQGGQVHRRHLSISLRDSHVTSFNRQILGYLKWNIARRNIYAIGCREIVFLYLSIILVFHQREKYYVTVEGNDFSRKFSLRGSDGSQMAQKSI